MINSMVKGKILVKATKVQIENSNEYYFEFQLDELQVQALVAELLVEHLKNNTLTIVHDTTSEKEKTMNFLRDIMEKNSDMSELMKEDFLKAILDMSKKA